MADELVNTDRLKALSMALRETRRRPMDLPRFKDLVIARTQTVENRRHAYLATPADKVRHVIETAGSDDQRHLRIAEAAQRRMAAGSKIDGEKFERWFDEYQQSRKR